MSNEIAQSPGQTWFLPDGLPYLIPPMSMPIGMLIGGINYYYHNNYHIIISITLGEITFWSEDANYLQVGAMQRVMLPLWTHAVNSFSMRSNIHNYSMSCHFKLFTQM